MVLRTSPLSTPSPLSRARSRGRRGEEEGPGARGECEQEEEEEEGEGVSLGAPRRLPPGTREWSGWRRRARGKWGGGR